MIPAIFINDSKLPFTDLILSGDKMYETRTRNMLGRFLGDDVLIVRTGKGDPLVVGSARIDCIIKVWIRSAWETYRPDTCVPLGSEFDWKPATKYKYLYRLTDVRSFDHPFTLPQDARRHGRTWAEYDGEIPC